VTHFQELEPLFQQHNAYLWEWLNEAIDCLDIMLDAINAILGPEAIFIGGHFPNTLVDYLIERLDIEATATRASQPDRYVMYQPKILRATSGDLSSALEPPPCRSTKPFPSDPMQPNGSQRYRTGIVRVLPAAEII